MAVLGAERTWIRVTLYVCNPPNPVVRRTKSERQVSDPKQTGRRVSTGRY
jgi:hypothetical protein